MDVLFTVAEARALMPELVRHGHRAVTARGDLAELSAALQDGGSSPLGGIAELKAAEAAFHEELAWFQAQGLQLKGVAPLLVDFPAEIDGVPVLLCWLESEPELAWYHRLDLGFAGRRPLPDTV